jgi:hypothetical protein
VGGSRTTRPHSFARYRTGLLDGRRQRVTVCFARIFFFSHQKNALAFPSDARVRVI